MKPFVSLFAIAALIVGMNVAGPAAAQEIKPPDENPQKDLITPEEEGSAEGDDLEQLGERDKTSLDNLFADLKRQTNAEAAKRISTRIWSKWTDSGSPTVDLLMNRAAKAMNTKNNPVALDLLDQVIRLKPGFAEGWNRRATLYFAMNDYSRSVGDIEKVLSIEPRHYGALSGLAVIMEQLGHKKQALKIWYTILEIYPANKDAQGKVITLEDEFSGNPT